MPFDSEKRSEKAVKQLRDKSGHFVSLKPKVKISGQANVLEKLVDTKGDPNSDAMFGIYFRDPFKKLMAILEDIKNKQSTKVNLSFTIPLVALPLAILFAFQFGRYQSACSDYFSSQAGTLHNTTIERTIAPTQWFQKALTYLPFMGDIYNKKVQMEQPVLIKEGNDNIVINNEEKIDLDAFIQSKVLISGQYNSCSKTLTLDSARNISNY